MEIGNEISQKIRSAIKAKLLDLGAYVDDELPDYIMVMVANKKTKAQMTEDLNLFLGTHTDKFTLWLHSLLCKLQSITAEMTPGGANEESQAEKAAKDKNILDEETWAVTKGGGGEQAVKKGEPSSLPVSTGPAKGQSKQVTQKVTEAPAIVEEPEINLRPEHDEFEEEVQAEMEKQKKEAKVTQHRKRVSSNTEKGSSTTESAVSKEKSSGSHISPKRRRHSKEQPEKVTGRVTPRRRQSSKDTEPKSGKEDKVSGSSRHGKKKRPLPSSVGAVIKHQVYASDDEYDPLNPAVGSVASVVKVTERKSSIPPDMQPNKSLLLKAMEAAHKSIEKLATKAIVKPTVRSKEVTEEEQEKQGKETKKEQKEVDVKETRSVSIRSRLGARHKPSISERLGEERKVQLVTRSSRESSRRIMSRKSSEDSEEGSKSKRRKDHTSDGGSLRLTDDVEQTDSRQFEIIVTRNVKHGSSRHAGSKTQREGSEEEDLVKILIEGAAEESDFTDAGEDVGRRMEAGIVDRIQEDSVRQSSRSEPVEKMIDPRFVVTLDGVDGVAMEKQEVIEDTRRVSPAKNVVMVKPQRATVDPVLINLSEDNDEEPQSGVTPGVSSPEVQKVQEKCRFWPACKTGELCPYVHPTTQCLKFPNCHFGERCVYVHPVCKFDAQCTRPGCPYTHSSKKPAFQPPTSIVLQPVRVPLFTPRPPVPAPVIQRATNAKELNCKFFPNCTNMECTFRHPKPCRFGIGCAQKSSCYFFHPNLPSKGQLKWSAQASKKPELTSQRPTSSLTSP